MGLNRQQKRAADRAAAKKLRKEELKDSAQAMRGEGAGLLKRVAGVEEQLGNINAWALGVIREQREQAPRLDMIATVTALLVKEALGRTLTDEEHAALVEAIDGPAKKEETSGEVTTESVEGSPAQPVSGDVPGERLESSGAQE